MDNPGVMAETPTADSPPTYPHYSSIPGQRAVQAENQVDTALPFLPPPHARLSERADLMRAVGPSPDCQER